jgi:hypothetical protein
VRALLSSIISTHTVSNLVRFWWGVGDSVLIAGFRAMPCSLLLLV